jgi:hypothetical protein
MRKTTCKPVGGTSRPGLQKSLTKNPTLKQYSFLLGYRSWERIRPNLPKNRKQDLMHIAVCTLLAPGGYYEFEKKDQDGWPHFRQLKPMPEMNAFEQENFLKDHVLLYFEENGI